MKSFLIFTHIHENFLTKFYLRKAILNKTGLPHTRGIQGNSGNLEIKNKIQRNSGTFDFF